MNVVCSARHAVLVTITAKLVVFLEFRMPNRPAVAIDPAARTAASGLLKLTPLKLRHALPIKPFEVSFIHYVRRYHRSSISWHFVNTNSGRIRGRRRRRVAFIALDETL